ncbi:unnamed protein product [Gadus morhua 'NCC']
MAMIADETLERSEKEKKQLPLPNECPTVCTVYFSCGVVLSAQPRVIRDDRQSGPEVRIVRRVDVGVPVLRRLGWEQRCGRAGFDETKCGIVNRREFPSGSG